MNQEHGNLELIIINDGSTDSTAERIKSIKDNRITFLDNTDQRGNYARRNEGCRLAKGKYIFVMDGDDTTMPNRISTQVAILESNAALLALGSDFRYENKIIEKPKDYEDIKV